MKKKILLFVSFIIVLCGCEDVFEPSVQNNRDLEEVRDEPRFAQGLLINGYARIPTNSWSFSEMATDDAVANNENNAYYTIATGQWAANNNPLNQWTNSKSAIQYLNLMLKEADSVKYSDNQAVNLMFADRIKGEAFGLRALFMYYLLQAHGGMAGSDLLGVPIELEPQDISSEFNKPRATFEQCMQQLYDDVEKAMELLPLDYADISDLSKIPEKYLTQGANPSDYNRVFGNAARLLVSERIVLAIRAQTALLAASPAFGQGNSTTWEAAANYAAEIINLNSGVQGLSSTGYRGVVWYMNDSTQVSSVSAGVNPSEILWRIDVGGVSNNLESDHYPPTLYGKGLLNPTQNLVDAFPMANGYPISDPASGYDPNKPYENRDPRLKRFILVNGSTAGPGKTTINTAIDGGTNDGLNKVETSTRTGYYMRKLLRQDVNMNPSSINSQLHIKPRIRYTEIYLMYAEAANEAWGPVSNGNQSYSAYEVIKAIRERAGLDNSDKYLESVKNDQVAMRELIRNERRLELSFEGFRFWDLRRWKKDLTEGAKGVRIQGGTLEVIPVENRVYEPHMIYGPVPYSEILKYGALQQNSGW